MATETIRVMVYIWADRVGGEVVWRGECTTLNLVTERTTYEKALQAMREQILVYVETACQGDRAGLIPRPSPFRRRLSHWLRHALSRFKWPRIYRHEEPILTTF